MDEAIKITVRNSQIGYYRSQTGYYREIARDLKKLSEEKQIELLYEHCCFIFRIKHGIDYDVRKKNIKYMDLWRVYDLMFEEVVEEVIRNIKQYM